nr:viral A-type inclusion protein [Haemonchus contortus]
MLNIPDSILPDGIVSAEQTLPAPLISSNDQISATAAARALFTNRFNHTRPSDSAACSNGKSTVEAPNSPNYRELLYEREVKRLQSQLNETEDQLVKVELEQSETKKKIEILIEEISRKNARIRDLERNEKSHLRAQEDMETKLTTMKKQVDQMQRHHEIQREKLVVCKENEDKWEAKRADLEETLNNKNNSVLLLERKLRDANDELLNRSKDLKSAELECTRLQRELEELSKSNDLQREEYQASVADWRNRFEKTMADQLSSCVADIERNANVAREIRAKTEEIERLQQLLENEKQHVESVVKECTDKSREADAMKSKLESLEAELARREELERSTVCNRCENMVNVKEKEEQNGEEKEEELIELNSARARIDRLESELSEREQLLCKKNEELEEMLSEKKKVDLEREEAMNELERKTESLKEALFIIDGLREGITEVMVGSDSGMPKGIEEEVHSQLSRITMVVQEYDRRFKHLETYLTEENRQQRWPVYGVDLTETIKDLQYRLFAANQKIAAFEKEKVDWKDSMQQLEDREELAKQKNSELTNEMNNRLRELDGLNEEKVNMEKTISGYRSEVESKSVQLENITKSVEELRKDNTLLLQLIATSKEEYDNERTLWKQQEDQHLMENEQLRSLSIKKEEEMQILREKVSSLERELKPCQEENVQLRLKINSLAEENENYKVATDKLKSVEIESYAESNASKTNSMLQLSRQRFHSAPTSPRCGYANHDPSAILTTRNSVKGEDNLRIGVAHEKVLRAHRFLKRTSFYQISRIQTGSKHN